MTSEAIGVIIFFLLFLAILGFLGFVFVKKHRKHSTGKEFKNEAFYDRFLKYAAYIIVILIVLVGITIEGDWEEIGEFLIVVSLWIGPYVLIALGAYLLIRWIVDLFAKRVAHHVKDSRNEDN